MERLNAEIYENALVKYFVCLALWIPFVISFNERHLRAAREFGIEVLKPAALLKLIDEIK